MKQILAIFAVISLVIVLSGCSGGERLGGSTSDSFDADGGFLVDGTTVIDSNGNVDGTITSDTGTFSSTLSVSGETTLGDKLKVDYATSTIQVGDTSDGIGEGCLVLGDSGGTTSTPVYITASGETISATTTQPSICE